MNIWFAEVSLQCIGSVVVNDHLYTPGKNQSYMYILNVYIGFPPTSNVHRTNCQPPASLVLNDHLPQVTCLKACTHDQLCIANIHEHGAYAELVQIHNRDYFLLTQIE